jgi:hypothetical protein
MTTTTMASNNNEAIRKVLATFNRESQRAVEYIAPQDQVLREGYERAMNEKFASVIKEMKTTGETKSLVVIERDYLKHLSEESEVRRLRARDSQPYPANRKNPSASNLTEQLHLDYGRAERPGGAARLRGRDPPDVVHVDAQDRGCGAVVVVVVVATGEYAQARGPAFAVVVVVVVLRRWEQRKFIFSEKTRLTKYPTWEYVK